MYSLFKIAILKMKKLSVFLTLVVVFFYSGCGVVGIVGTPRAHEEKVVAEYDLAEHKDQKILVLVNQPVWLNAQVNLRYYLTKAINKNLTAKVKILPEYIVSYSELSKFRSNQADFLLLSPVEVGEALSANVVLLVEIGGYELNKIAGTSYYEGFLGVQSAFLDVATGEKIWPESAKSKIIKVGFDVESGGQEIAVKRLAAASTYCLIRYFYDCPKNEFKIADDRSGIGWVK
jgi:hypothetical protein